jgi:hypothetical protein
LCWINKLLLVKGEFIAKVVYYTIRLLGNAYDYNK